MLTATKAQVKALRWLISHGRTDAIDSVALWDMYQSESDLRAHALRVVAWKRISGRNMAGMERAGLLSIHRLTYGSISVGGLYSPSRVYYTITEDGLEVAAS